MDTKKLDKWAELLLDTGKRNNLISFKDTKATTVEVLFPSPDTVFQKVDGTACFFPRYAGCGIFHPGSHREGKRVYH